MQFNFATVGRIRFGSGIAANVASAATQMARRVMIVCGRSSERITWLTNAIEQQGLAHTVFCVGYEPDVQLVRNGVEQAHAHQCDGVISCGGGSVIDAAKAIAILATNGGDALDYMEVIGRGQPLTKPSLPHIAIPTTAGTGAEVTKNAVLAAPEARVKVSLRSEHMLPAVAFVDPVLTYSMPQPITASTGLDALTQCIEPYVSSQANALTDILALEGVRRAASALPIVYENGKSSKERSDMAFASLLGGLALANAKLGAVHGFAGVLGGMYSAPHGNLCARLLPYVFEQNVHALLQREPENPVIARFRVLASTLTGDANAEIADAVTWLHKLCEDLQVPSLREYGVDASEADDIVSKSMRSSSMQGNPIQLTHAELLKVLDQAIG